MPGLMPAARKAGEGRVAPASGGQGVPALQRAGGRHNHPRSSGAGSMDRFGQESFEEMVGSAGTPLERLQRRAAD
ncbi:hypothetical protein, partial [Mesorhizobium sp. M8A.F.Ca.ET.207.01.1.1]|uniref:hypothetical protein n=1 Tax=Mesorhizobium sp. M8A.F.Ca.ET.207.01.1.1 TaxID=2563968 RepID=UPI001AEE99E4